MTKTIIDAEVSYGLTSYGVRMSFPPLYLGLVVIDGVVTDVVNSLFIYKVRIQSSGDFEHMVLVDWVGNEYVLTDIGTKKVRAALACG